ncbi:MAG: ATPase, T2SS/T4P/T4SS family [Gammaproteobacteria bacterium]
MEKAVDAASTWGLVKYYMKPIEIYLNMSGVTEIMVDRFDEIYIEKNGRIDDVLAVFKSNAEVERLIEQMGNALNQPVHADKFPILDARLPRENGRAGARINANLSTVSTRGASITIRVFPQKILEANDLLSRGAMTDEMLAFLRLAILCRCNVIVSGGTGSGKTTLINVLCSFIPAHERVVVIEDTAELQIRAGQEKPRLVSMEAPRRKAELNQDSQHLDMSFLLQNALRQRPDRIVVGEIRSPDAATSFLQAINTGHEGCMTTLHANSTKDALARMEGLAAARNVGLPYEVVQSQVRGNVHLLIQQQKILEPDNRVSRRIIEIAEMVEGEMKLLWSWDYKLKQHVNRGDVGQSNVIKTAERFDISAK